MKHEYKVWVEKNSNNCAVSGHIDKYKIKSHLQNYMVVKMFTIQMFYKANPFFKNITIFMNILRNNMLIYMA